MASERLGNDLIVKSLRDEDSNQRYWIIFEEGELKQPLVILTDFQMVKLTAVFESEQNKNPH
jgi:hypothetical protein